MLNLSKCFTTLAPFSSLLAALLAGCPTVTAPGDAADANAVDARGGDGDAVTDASLDSGMSSDAIDDAQDAALCNALVNNGAEVQETLTTTPPPTPVGGSIVEGTYRLTSATIYNAPVNEPGLMFRGSLMVMGDVMQLVTEGGSQPRQTYTFSTSGLSLLLTPTCPTGADPLTQSYSATATQFTIFSSDGNNVLTYTRP